MFAPQTMMFKSAPEQLHMSPRLASVEVIVYA